MKGVDEARKGDNVVIYSSYRNLLAQGWRSTNKAIKPEISWPISVKIILEKDDKVLVHSYRIYDDSSDYAGDEAIVTWTSAKLVPVSLYSVEHD